TNSTFANNGLYGIHNVDAGQMFVTNCTFSGNEYAIFVENTAVVTLGGTILKSSVNNLRTSGSATITSQGYNLSDDFGGGFLTGTGDQIGTNPGLDPNGLQNNGGR